MNPLASLVSSLKGSLSSTRAVLLVSAGVVLILISATVLVALKRDHVTPGIEGVLGIATGFFISTATLKWGQSKEESKDSSQP